MPLWKYNRTICRINKLYLMTLIFKYHLIKILMVYVTTVSYFVLVNGEPNGIIHHSRGICQGEPLSPFPFYYILRVVMVWSQRLPFWGKSRVIHYVELIHGWYIFFLQMIVFFFCNATKQECQIVLDILDTYGRCSGQ